MPWDDVDLELHEVSAIKAIPAATFKVLEKLTGVDLMSFTILGGEEGRRATDYAEGKRSIGVVLRKLRDMKMPSPQQRHDSGPHAVPTGEPPKD